MNIAIAIEYDGQAFQGWQSQAHGQTVQDVLQFAISQIAQSPIKLHAAGRTDTGVHATTQVAHFLTDTIRPMSAWVRGVNAYLPTTIRVLWAKEIADDFHARFSAHGRHYQYWLYNAPIFSAILHGKVGWFHLPLNVSAMQQGMSYLVGTHDFSAFRASECQAKSPVKTLRHAQLTQYGQYFLFEFSANAFLQHQVRNMVGALVYIGCGRLLPTIMPELLLAKNRCASPPTFMPDGLYLTGVDYAEEWQLPVTHRNALDLLRTR